MALSDIYQLNSNSFKDVGYDLSSQYANLGGYLEAYKQLADQQSSLGSYERPGLVRRLDSLLSNFSSQFENLVGRAPTEAEMSKYLSNGGAQSIINSPNGRSEENVVGVNNEIANFIGTNFKKTAEEYAKERLEGQRAQANTLADLFRTQGAAALNDTEASLINYQQKLFERLRPNLITSLQAQGLLNTGGLNEAVAGAQSDLATEGTNWLAQRKLELENQANQIAFSGEAAPYEYERANIMGQVPWLQQMGQQAAEMNFNKYMTDVNYQNQLGLLAAQTKAQKSLQPSFLRTLGQSTASSMGSSFGQWFSPSTATTAAGGGF